MVYQPAVDRWLDTEPPPILIGPVIGFIRSWRDPGGPPGPDTGGRPIEGAEDEYETDVPGTGVTVRYRALDYELRVQVLTIIGPPGASRGGGGSIR